jgi:hypothetical protein
MRYQVSILARLLDILTEVVCGLPQPLHFIGVLVVYKFQIWTDGPILSWFLGRERSFIR